MKTITKKQFRILLMLPVVALVASAFAGIFNSQLLPQPLLDYQQSQHGVRPTTSEVVIGLLGIPGVVAALVALVGLYRFWSHARWLSVVAWIYMLVWMSISPEPVLSNAIDGAFSQLSALLSGAVLAIVFFSPAAEWYHRRS